MFKAPKLFASAWKPSITTVRRNPYPTSFQYFLKCLNPVQCSQLGNGVVIATEERSCLNACIGFYIDGGSRYERGFENGIAHFFEHIVFKGTQTRNKTCLEQQMAATGAKFKCFTTREMVCYYAECLYSDVGIVVDILCDCIFNNNYACAEIEMQKKIVYEEMLAHDNKDAESVLRDHLHSAAYQGTGLAQTIFGPSSNVHNMTERNIRKFQMDYYLPPRVVMAAVGAVKHNYIVQLANRFLCNLPPSASCDKKQQYRFTGSEIRFRNDSMPTALAAVAVEGPPFGSEDSLVMDLAAAVIGGWDRSQTGGQNHASFVVRAASSEHFCDSFKSINITYKDTGLWGIQFMSRSVDLEDMLYVVQSEWMGLCNTISDGELMRTKREFKTKLLKKTESCTNACHDIGRWILYNNCIRPSIYDRICAIDKVYAPQLRETCTKYLYDKCPVVAAVGPCEGLPEYNRIRSSMYWLRI